MTITLLWNAAVDLDLMFNCVNEDNSLTLIYYSTLEATGECQGKLDHDMRETQYPNTLGNGDQGMIENISVGVGRDGVSYEGHVNYFKDGNAVAPAEGEAAGPTTNAPFNVIFSGVDDAGVLHLFDQHTVTTFDVVGANSNYSFTYNDPDAGGK